MGDYQLQYPIQATLFNKIRWETEDQILQPGTFIADVSPSEDILGNRVWYFMASSDGETWRDYKSYENPEGEGENYAPEIGPTNK